MKITAKFRASRRLRFEDTKRIMSPEIRPKSFGTFEKQAPGPRKSFTNSLLCSFGSTVLELAIAQGNLFAAPLS